MVTHLYSDCTSFDVQRCRRYTCMMTTSLVHIRVFIDRRQRDVCVQVKQVSRIYSITSKQWIVPTSDSVFQSMFQSCT